MRRRRPSLSHPPRIVANDTPSGSRSWPSFRSVRHSSPHIRERRTHPDTKEASVLAAVRSAVLEGVDGRVVTVEVHVSAGLPGYTVVGLPDTAGRESRERVRAALLSSGLDVPAATRHREPRARVGAQDGRGARARRRARAVVRRRRAARRRARQRRGAGRARARRARAAGRRHARARRRARAGGRGERDRAGRRTRPRPRSCRCRDRARRPHARRAARMPEGRAAVARGAARPDRRAARTTPTNRSISPTCAASPTGAPRSRSRPRARITC